MSGPNFLCIGQQKAASQWLYDQLRAHDAFWMPPLKELHFFDRGFNFKRGRKMAAKLMQRVSVGRDVDLRDVRFCSHAYFSPTSAHQETRARGLRRNRREARTRGLDMHVEASYLPTAQELAWYRRLFHPAGTCLTGEITPAYSALAVDAIGSIHTAFPDLRIIMLIRHPVDRLWSLLRMRTFLGQTPNSDSALEEIERFMHTDPATVRRSFPSVIWRNWSGVFNADRIGVFLFDDIANDPDGTRQAVVKFLGVDPAAGSFRLAPDHNAKKSSAGGRAIPPRLLERMNDYFRVEIDECRRLFGVPWSRIT